MGFREGINLTSLLTSFLVIVWYAFQILPQMGQGPVEFIAFTQPMIIAVIAGVILSIVTTIAVSIGAAVWLGVREGEDAVNAEFSEEDERDKQFARLGDAWGGYFLSVAVIGALALIWTGQDRFWVANALFLGAWGSAVVGTVVKLIAYRRGA